MPIAETDIHVWLDRWRDLIVARDYVEARSLFAPDVVAYGTVTGYMRGLDELERRQWRQVWGRTKDFAFCKETLFIVGAGATAATVGCLWQSSGMTQQDWYARRGRMTLVLERREVGLVCVHSHLSMEPGIPPLDPASSPADASHR